MHRDLKLENILLDDRGNAKVLSVACILVQFVIIVLIPETDCVINLQWEYFEFVLGKLICLLVSSSRTAAVILLLHRLLPDTSLFYYNPDGHAVVWMASGHVYF